MKHKLMFVLAAVAVTACGNADADLEARDLAIGADVDSIMPMDDSPAVEDADASAPATPPAAPRPRPQPASLAEGSTFTAFTVGEIDDRENAVGDTVLAEIRGDLVDARGRTVIPAGSFLVGTVAAFHEAENQGELGLQVVFAHIDINGVMHDIGVAVDTLPYRKDGTGVTAGDAAKVGAGAVVGAVAGRIIGGNSRGTAVGAAAGAAAGAGVAVATHNAHVVLDAGSAVRVVLTSAFRAAR